MVGADNHRRKRTPWHDRHGWSAAVPASNCPDEGRIAHDDLRERRFPHEHFTHVFHASPCLFASERILLIIGRVSEPIGRKAKPVGLP